MHLETVDRKRGLFGGADDIGAQRGIGEFHAGRPVVIVAGEDEIVALPVDGLTEATRLEFSAWLRPARPRLALTARRARMLGIEAQAPVVVELGLGDTRDSIWTLAAGEEPARVATAVPASEAAVRAIELAKLAERVPALLVADRKAIVPSALDNMLSVRADAIARFRSRILDTLEIVSDAPIPLAGGTTARFCVFRDAVGRSPVAIMVGKPDLSGPVTVRVHSACLTGDVFGSRRCDCGAQLKLAISQLSEAGGGIVLYLEQEGRGLGLANKMRAYRLQDHGFDTVDANRILGFDDDERTYGVAARMLKMIGVSRVRLLTNNPDKLQALTRGGLDVSARIPLHTPIHSDNRRYLATKAARAGHLLDAMLETGTD